MASSQGTRVSDVTRDLRVLVLVAGVTLLLLAGVVISANWGAGDTTPRTVALIAALDLNTLAATPSGSAARLPGGAHAAVVLRQIPGAAPPVRAPRTMEP